MGLWEYKSITLLLILVGFASCFGEDAPSANSTKPITSTLEEMREDMIKKHPALSQWLDKVKDRFMKPPNASEDDLNSVRSLWRSMQNKVYEFVVSPAFNQTANLLEQELVTFTNLALGVVPLKELEDLYKILKSDPELEKMYLEGEETALKFLSRESIHQLRGWLADLSIDSLKDKVKQVKNKLMQNL